MFFAEAVSKSFGALDVLDDVSFVAGTGERVGLVGPNGAGKTTLLRLLAGEDEPGRGRSAATAARSATCARRRGWSPTARSSTSSGRRSRRRVRQRSASTRSRPHLERGDGDIDGLIAEQGELFERFEQLDGYRIERRIGRVLDGLGFATGERAKLCGEFSGGWQMRIALAKVLVRRPDCLLLDEPTNHLDARSRDWLAEDLSTYRGTVLVVTHDGEFLDRVATRILELRERGVESYAGNYSDYQRQKAARLQQQDRAAARQEREIARQQRFIDRFRAKASKATVVKSREKALAKVERIERERPQSEVHISLSADGRTEHDVLVHGGHHATPTTTTSCCSTRACTSCAAQKAVLVGPNGSGKTHAAEDRGGAPRAERGHRALGAEGADRLLRPAPGRSARTRADRARGGASRSRRTEAEVRLRTVLGQFLFRGDDVFKRIEMLSGGERSRVALAKLVLQPTNVLILDEPTNHLDRSTRRKLLEVLEKYDGTILCAATILPSSTASRRGCTK